MRLLVGTSGWQYRHWWGPFYPRDLSPAGWLEYYAARFATVELNASFYRLPSATTFAGWARRLPADFVMAVKASRYLTHVRRLQDPEEPVQRLLDGARALGERLGPVLLQLPPGLDLHPARLEATLACFPSEVRVAVELRDRSWFVDEVRSVLERHKAALCLADRGSRPVSPVWPTTTWTYLRFHQGQGRPAPGYGDTALRRWLERLLAEPRWEVGYVYFNNDAECCAVRDAVRFAALARRAGCEVARATLEPAKATG